MYIANMFFVLFEEVWIQGSPLKMGICEFERSCLNLKCTVFM